MILTEAFRPVPFGAVVLKQGAFPPKDQFVWTCVNTAIALGCGTKQASRDHLEEEVSARLPPFADCASEPIFVGVARLLLLLDAV